MTTNIFIIHLLAYFLLHKKMYNNIYLLLYNKKIYNDNKYFCYIRRYIMTTNISVIYESIFLIIQEDI